MTSDQPTGGKIASDEKFKTWELPESWKWQQLFDVTQPIRSLSPKTVFPDEFHYIDTAAIDNKSHRVTVPTPIKSKEAPSRARQQIQANDTLFSNVRVYLENIGLVPSELHGHIASTAFCVLRPSEAIHSQLMFQYMSWRTTVAFLNKKQRGDSPPAILDKDVRAHLIPVAPINEQARIVSKIDELFSRIEAGEKALQRAKILVERYRKSVLKAAVTGELTKDWRENNKDKIEPANKLLERILKSRREAWEKSELAKMKAKGKQPKDDAWKKRCVEPTAPDTTDLPDLPEGWVWVTLDHICECLDYMRVPINRTDRATNQGEFPYYGANGQIGTYGDYIFDEELVLVVEDETFTGRTKPFSYKIVGKSWVNNHAHVLRPNKSTTVNFLNFSLMFYPFIPLTTGTTARRKLTQRALMSAPLAIPSLHEQEHITQLVAEVLDRCVSIEGTFVEIATQRNTLCQSVLKSAFEGKLVPQDLSDEPASALLGRIRSAIATPKPSKLRKVK